MSYNKNKILEKSRTENKDKDLFEKELQANTAYYGVIAAALLATIFVVVQMLVGKGMNYGLYAIVFSMLSINFIIRAKRFKRSREIAFAVLYTVVTLVFSIVYIFELISSSAVI